MRGVTDLATLSTRQRDLVTTWLPGLHVERDHSWGLFDGYGSDPRESEAWRRHQLRDAIATATWAFGIGDVTFEEQGQRMIVEALAAF